MPAAMNILDIETLPDPDVLAWTPRRIADYCRVAMDAVDVLRRGAPGQRVGIWSVPMVGMRVSRAMAMGDSAAIHGWRQWAAGFLRGRQPNGRYADVGLLDVVDCLWLDLYCPHPRFGLTVPAYLPRLVDEFGRIGKPVGAYIWHRHHNPPDYAEVVPVETMTATCRAIREAGIREVAIWNGYGIKTPQERDVVAAAYAELSR
jgi:hypothetical protein